MISKYMESEFPTDKFDAKVGGATGSAQSILNDVFGKTGWTYEVKQVTHGQKATFIVATVYMPGLIRDGMGFGQDANAALNEAIMYVINSLKVQAKPATQPPQTQQAPVQAPPAQPVQQQTPPPQSAPAGQGKSLTLEEILASLMQMFHINKVQAEKLHNIRSKYNIISKQQLLKYLQNWNPEIKDSSELNATNIDAFADWAENNKPEGFVI